MITSLIVAMDEQRGIGKAGKLPWHLSADLRRFRELTMGHHILMGRKTFDSIGKPLPGRQTIIVTRNPGLKPEGCLVAHSVQEGIALARERGEGELFVIGGGEIYAQAFEVAGRIYLTQVHAVVDADTFFPEFDRDAWTAKESFEHSADYRNQYAFAFKLLERKSAN